MAGIGIAGVDLVEAVEAVEAEGDDLDDLVEGLIRDATGLWASMDRLSEVARAAHDQDARTPRLRSARSLGPH